MAAAAAALVAWPCYHTITKFHPRELAMQPKSFFIASYYYLLCAMS